jgi:ATP-dependent DNA helicase DinG
MIMISSDEASSDLVAQTEHFFGPETPLADAHKYGGRAYEERPQQADLAALIANSLVDGTHLCAEAPTGIGKSFAYLIPAIYHARNTGKPVLITTHTIALQEQLLDKDIPLLQQLVDVPFKAALAKGRSNYLCLGRLHKTVDNTREYLPSEDMVPEIKLIAEWAEQTRDGSLADLDFRPNNQTWSSVCAEQDACPLGNVERESQCFFMRARRRAFTADIIIANHALFCVDLAMKAESDGQQSLLPEYSAVIIDEAHTFEDVASTHLGVRVSSYSVMITLGRLYNTRSHRGLLTRGVAEPARQAIIAFTDQAQRFFDRIRLWMEEQHTDPLTYTIPGHIPNLLESGWSDARTALLMLLEQDGLDADFRSELKLLVNRLSDFCRQIDTFLNMTMDNCVYWMEQVGRTKRHISLNIVPVEVHNILRDLLFTQAFPVIMTSATLAVRNKLAYFQNRVGAESAQGCILDSPYDYQRQLELHVPYSEMPQPNSPDFIPAICDQIRNFILKTEGKAFVLFTSYKAMNEAAERLHDFFEHNRLQLLVQGRHLQRSQMLDVFRKDINSVIFGTDSFWMGVDVPGEALSNVIIVKLPFPVPSHPLIAARKRRIEENGGNSFRDYFLPEAILKFRQGVGRLIRGRDDEGIVVVLDPRIIRSSYGQAFLESIPDCHRLVF